MAKIGINELLTNDSWVIEKTELINNRYEFKAFKDGKEYNLNFTYDEVNEEIENINQNI